jgi:hypothetical protein
MLLLLLLFAFKQQQQQQINNPTRTSAVLVFMCLHRFNPPGKSPPFCVEYYTGWLTHWGEVMTNTSTDLVGTARSEIRLCS